MFSQPIDDFIDFCRDVFPSISDAKHDAAKRAIQDACSSSRNYKLTMPPLSTSLLAQGDVFDKVYFSYMTEGGEIREKFTKGILLTNTCDNERRDNLLFAPIRHISDLFTEVKDIKTLKENKFYSLMYLNEMGIEEDFIDFNIISTVNRKWFCENITQKKTNRLFSLSQIGYYVFICKLTIYLMRYEDKGVNISRIY